jgi:hypothetical protein
MITLQQKSQLAASITEQVKMAAIATAKTILDADKVNAMFYGSEAAYNLLTQQAQRIVRLSADNNRGIINALAEIIAVGVESEKIGDEDILAAMPGAIEKLAGLKSADRLADGAERQLVSTPEFQKLVAAMLEKVAWQVLNGEIQVSDPGVAKQVISEPNGYVLLFARVIVRDGITEKSTEEEVFLAIRKNFAPVMGVTLTAELK